MDMLSTTSQKGVEFEPQSLSRELNGEQQSASMLPLENITHGSQLARVLKLGQAQEGECWRIQATVWYQGQLNDFTWQAEQPALTVQSGHLIQVEMSPVGPSLNKGVIQVHGVLPATRVDPDVFLLDTVPSSWLPASDASTGENSKVNSTVSDFRTLWGVMSRPMRAWFNAIFWFEPKRLSGFLTSPASMNHHHSRKHGLLIHSVDCAMRAILSAWYDDLVNTDVLLMAALTHDIGKAGEYCFDASKKTWVLSDRGTLMGHRLTHVEWMATARGLLSANDGPTDLQALATYHAIHATHAPEWVGLRSPRTPEAFYLASVDTLSGQCDLIRSLAKPDAVRGRYHPAFRGGAYVTASRALQ